MSSELERIRFQIAVQEEVVRIEQKKAQKAFEYAEQQKEVLGYQDSDAREKEGTQSLIVFDEEKKLRDLKEAERECLRGKRY